VTAALSAGLKDLKRNAEQEDARAQYRLGRKYEYGDGVRENTVKAVKWYRKAAEQGLAAAQYSLGRMYASGLSVRQDYIRGAEVVSQVGRPGLRAGAEPARRNV
jgi:TPR repeat protein